MDSKNCYDCGVKIGERHLDFCDVERCPCCGGQLLSCDCGGVFENNERIAWGGFWPGSEECKEFGWYAKMVKGKGWVSCHKDEDGASEDLNRLYIDAKWDRKKQRFLKK